MTFREIPFEAPDGYKVPPAQPDPDEWEEPPAFQASGDGDAGGVVPIAPTNSYAPDRVPQVYQPDSEREMTEPIIGQPRYASGIDGLLAFLNAQLDEDERMASALEAGFGIYPDGHTEAGAAFLDRFDAGRMLTEVDVKRRIVNECVRTLDYEDHGYALAEFVLRTMGVGLAGRDGYRREWAPR